MFQEGLLTRFGGKIEEIAGKILDLVYPDSLYCICCGNLIDDTRTYSLCDHCIKHIKWDLTDGRMIVCDSNGITERSIRRSDGGMRQIDNDHKHMRALRVCEYGIYERTLIFSLKYNGKRYIARNIADMMYDKLEMIGMAGTAGGNAFDVIVPVPLSESKLRSRGFNQTALIGKYLGRKLGIPSLEGALMRTRETRPMRGLSPEERKENVHGAFSLKEEAADDIRGKSVLLLDDFFTTGATAVECAKALEAADTKVVTLYAFAAR